MAAKAADAAVRADFTKDCGGWTLHATFELLPGGITVLRGDSGSGKTTIADALAGIRALDSGRIAIGGLIADDAPAGVHLPPQRRGIGYVFQTHRLLPHLSAEENIRFPAEHGGRRPRIAFGEAVRLLGLERLLGRNPSSLSGGESQRAAIARALMAAQSLLILDEPLSSLDPARRERLMDYILAAVERLDIHHALGA